MARDATVNHVVIVDFTGYPTVGGTLLRGYALQFVDGDALYLGSSIRNDVEGLGPGWPRRSNRQRLWRVYTAHGEAVAAYLSVALVRGRRAFESSEPVPSLVEGRYSTRKRSYGAVFAFVQLGLN